MVISSLPTLDSCIASLTHWQVIRISGKDASLYFQGQVTADITLLNDSTVSFAAHCDANGKVVSTLLVFLWKNAIYYLVRKSVAQTQIEELKKYAVFSDVTFHITQDRLIGLWGPKAPAILQKLTLPCPSETHPLSTQDDIAIIRLNHPQTRFLLIVSEKQCPTFMAQIEGLSSQICSENEWVIQDIKAGYPIVDDKNSFQFLPQALNLDKIGGISLTKGCYRGQEMVARATYRGANKRALFSLTGKSLRSPQVGDTIQFALGEHWRDGGRILASAQLDDNKMIIQAVMSQATTAQDIFRIKEDPESQFTAQIE